MNIEEYRAMKAQIEEGKEDSTTKEQPDAQVESTPNVDVQATSKEDTETPSDAGKETKPTEESQTQDKVETIEIDGQHVPIDELRNGYLRQQDYTKKTQEVSRQRQEAEQALEFMKQIQSNPELAQALAQQTNTPILDPAQQRVVDLENKYYDLLLEKEINELTGKYEDFEVREVLQVAQEKQLTNLEDAYLLSKSRNQAQTQAPNVDDLKAQIRQELLKELKGQDVDTSTIIQSGGDVQPVKDTRPVLSPTEVKIARNMGMAPEEYAKWRDVK